MASSHHPKQQPDFVPPTTDASGNETGSVQQSSGWLTADELQQRDRKAPSAKLPWVLVAMLTALCCGLAGILLVQSRELDRLRAVPGPAPVTQTPSQTQTQGQEQGQGQTAQPQQAPTSQQPAQQPQQQQQSPEAIKLMKSLPRRVEGDPLALGKKDAPVVMIAWSDFRCPFCSVWGKRTLAELQPYIDSGSLRIEHRDYVLFGDQSLDTAKAARAAGRQGKFWEFYHAVHDAAPTSGHPEIGPAELKAFAVKAGIPDMAKWAKDMTSSEVAAEVAKDSTQAQQIGLNSTPAFVINTTYISGAQPTQTFAQIIEGYGGKK